MSPQQTLVSGFKEAMHISARQSKVPAGLTPTFYWDVKNGPDGSNTFSSRKVGTDVDFSIADFATNDVTGLYEFEMTMHLSDGTDDKTSFTVVYNPIFQACGEDLLTCMKIGVLGPDGRPQNSCLECALAGMINPTSKAPVNLSSGSMWHTNTDFVLGGRTPATSIHWDRTYTANAATRAGDLGPNWRHPYESKLETAGQSIAVQRSRGSFAVRADNSLVWVDEVGAAYVFQKNGANTYSGPPGQKGILTEFADRFELLKRNRQKLTFSKSPFGKLTLITEPHGETTQLTYDGGGKLLSISTALAGTVSFQRNGAGRISIATRERDNLHYEYGYDTNGRLATVTDFAGLTYKYAYVTDKPGTYAQGMLATITDPLMRTISYQYNSDGQVIKQTEADGAIRTISYGDHQTAVTDVDGQTTTYRNLPVRIYEQQNETVANSRTYFCPVC